LAMAVSENILHHFFTAEALNLPGWLKEMG
jgi:hypothetical protein